MRQLVSQLCRILLLYLASAAIASAADVPTQQQQFLSIIGDFAQKYEAAPKDSANSFCSLRAKCAFRQIVRRLRKKRMTDSYPTDPKFSAENLNAMTKAMRKIVHDKNMSGQGANDGCALPALHGRAHGARA